MKTALERVIEDHRTKHSPEGHGEFLTRIDQAKSRCQAYCEMPKCGLISGVFSITLRTVQFKDGPKRICQHCMAGIVANMKKRGDTNA